MMAGAFLTMSDQPTILRWAGDVMGFEDWTHDSIGIAVCDGDTQNIRAVWVLNMFHDQGAWLHIATDGGRNWARRDVLRQIALLVFDHYGLERVTARIAVSNIASQILCLKVGFVVEGVERRALRGEDVAIFAMFRDTCPWLIDLEEMEKH